MRKLKISDIFDSDPLNVVSDPTLVDSISKNVKAVGNKPHL